MARAHQYLQLTVAVGWNVTSALALNFPYTDRPNIITCGFFSVYPTTYFKTKGIGLLVIMVPGCLSFSMGKKVSHIFQLLALRTCHVQDKTLAKCLLDYILQETVDILLMVLTENDAQFFHRCRLDLLSLCHQQGTISALVICWVLSVV